MYTIKPSRVLSLSDLDKLYHEHDRAIVINDLPLESEEDRERLKALSITTYNKVDCLRSVPTCVCGKKTRGDNEGVICTKCGSIVTTTTTRELKPDLFIRCPESVPAMLSPIAWCMLTKALDLGKTTNGLIYLVSRTARAPAGSKNAQKFTEAFRESGLPRGFNCFIDNFQVYLAFILNCVSNFEARKELHDFFNNYGDQVFTQYLPIPSKVAFVVEVAHVGTYYDKTMDAMIEAVFTAAGLTDGMSEKKVEAKTVSIQELLGRYYTELLPKIIASKPGILRRSCYGTRNNFSWRNIITSLHGVHRYDEIKIPYALGLTMLHAPVMNKLVRKHGMRHKDAYRYIESHSVKIDPFLMDILNGLVADTEDGYGIMCAFTRYPSLKRSSTQCLYITGFTEFATELSVLVLTGPNADFDGDQLQGLLILDKKKRALIKMLEPHYDIHSTSNPGQLTSNIKLPDTAVTNFFNFIDSEEMVI